MEFYYWFYCRKTCQSQSFTHDVIDELQHLSLSKYFPHYIINIGSQMNFHSIRRIMKRVVCFISPSLWRGDIKHTSVIIHRMEWKFIWDPLQQSDRQTGRHCDLTSTYMAYTPPLCCTTGSSLSRLLFTVIKPVAASMAKFWWSPGINIKDIKILDWCKIILDWCKIILDWCKIILDWCKIQ